MAPSFFCDMTTACDPSRALRSAEKSLPYIPRTKCKTLGERAFSIAGPHEWNRLPLAIRQAESVAVFKSRPKTYLFTMYFKWNHIALFIWLLLYLYIHNCFTCILFYYIVYTSLLYLHLIVLHYIILL